MALVEKLGGVFVVNDGTTGTQFEPQVAALASGQFVVVWNNLNDSIRGKFFTATNQPVFGELQISTTNVNAQFAPTIATLSDGTFVVAWAYEFSATDIDVRARRFTESGEGTTANDFFVSDSSTFDETLPAITAQDDGRYLVTWSQDNGLVNFRQNGADGTFLSGGVMDLSPPGAAEGRSDVTALLNGTYVCAYEQGGAIFQRQLIAGYIGTQVNPNGFGVADRPSIAALEGGGYVVVHRLGGDAGNSARPFVFGQVYDALGNKVGGGFNPIALPSAVDQSNAVVTGLVGGGWLVAWDDAFLGLRALTYDRNGNTVGDLIQLTPQGAGGSLGTIDVTQKRDGDVVVVWTGADANGPGINAQILRVSTFAQGNSAGNTLFGNVSSLNPGGQANDQLFGLAGDDTLVGFGGAADLLDGGTGIDTVSYFPASRNVVARLTRPLDNGADAAGDTYVSIENLAGTNFGDILEGDGNANTLTGFGGDDFLGGLGGNDFLIASDGNDILWGGDGNDNLRGGQGNDAIRGDSGTDYASYFDVGAAVTVDLRITGAQNTIGAGTDTITLVENLSGGSGNDTLRGNSAGNVIAGNAGSDLLEGFQGNDTLQGGDGNDTLRGGTGNDSLQGGSGTDLASYFDITAAVTVDLALSFSQNTVGAGFDTLSSIETLSAGAGNDTLRGNSGANAISGNAGTDTIEGRGGADALTGGTGADRFVYRLVSDAAPGGTLETIADFSQAAGDRIDLELIDVNSLLAGDQDFSFIGANAFTAGARGQLRYSGGVLSGEVTGNAVADFQIRLTGSPAITSAAFDL